MAEFKQRYDENVLLGLEGSMDPANTLGRTLGQIAQLTLGRKISRGELGLAQVLYSTLARDAFGANNSLTPKSVEEQLSCLYHYQCRSSKGGDLGSDESVNGPST
jgi:hypothetical protein